MPALTAAGSGAGREVEVEGDQRTTGFHGSVQNGSVIDPPEAFVVNSVHVVAGAAKMGNPAEAEVLIELELTPRR